eukprot:GHVS01029389.1.p1 GENE.GHVS01029389.1~~GHVS01029389.1.p1  ORF type:complete len:579 (+),score=92.61 GHVS01029389.1:166-1902(+)
MNQAMANSHSEIISALTKDGGAFFENLKSTMRENVTAALMLRDLLTSVKSVPANQPAERVVLFQCLRQHNVLEELAGYLDGTAPAVPRWDEIAAKACMRTSEYFVSLPAKLCSASHRPDPLDADRTPAPSALSVATEILSLAGDQDPAIVRHTIFRNATSRADHSPYLWLLMCDVLESCDNEGVQTQMKDIMMKVINTKEVIVPERDEIGTFFYDKGILSRLLQILGKPHDSPTLTQSQRNGLMFAKSQVMDILSLCAREHRTRFRRRAYIERIPARVIQCAMHPRVDKSLAISAVKCLRACVGLKDSYIERHLEQYRCLKPVMWMLRYSVWPCRFRGEGSLLQAVCLELLTFIDINGIKVLILAMGNDSDSRRWMEELERQDQNIDEGESFGVACRPCGVFERLLCKYKDLVSSSKDMWETTAESTTAGDSVWRLDSIGMSRAGRPIRLRPTAISGGDFEDDDSYFEAADDDDEDMQVEMAFHSVAAGAREGGRSLKPVAAAASPATTPMEDFTAGVPLLPQKRAQMQQEQHSPEQQKQPTPQQTEQTQEREHQPSRSSLVEGYEDDEDEDTFMSLS